VMAAQEARGGCAQESSIVSKHFWCGDNIVRFYKNFRCMISEQNLYNHVQDHQDAVVSTACIYW
jgi:hypothetical protein